MSTFDTPRVKETAAAVGLIRASLVSASGMLVISATGVVALE
jgi:hypothetical protein